MGNNNIHVLSADARKVFNERYHFEYKDGFILARTSNYSKITAHGLDKKFYLRSNVGKMTITQVAMKFWVENFKDKYTLVDVQNAINSLIVSYQTPDVNTITNQLKLTAK